tara:strand:- start:410 stop:673 length:264 start_codon:yes stop_codon:yes gene_type:complete
MFWLLFLVQAYPTQLNLPAAMSEITSRITVRKTGDIVWPFEYIDELYGRFKRSYVEPDIEVFESMQAYFDEIERTKNHMEPDWWNYW